MAKAKRTPAKTSSKKMGTGTKLALVAGAILGASALMKGSSTKTTPTKPTTPVAPVDQYNNKFVVAPNGNWYYILNGKKYFASQASLTAYGSLNPGVSHIDVSQDVVDKYETISNVDPVTFFSTQAKRIQIGA